MKENTDLVKRLRKEKEICEAEDYKQGHEDGKADAQHLSYKAFLYCDEAREWHSFEPSIEDLEFLIDSAENAQPSNYEIYALGWRDGVLSVWDDVKGSL